MAKFTFSALPAGPPSRRNWYQELLDDPQCHGQTAQVREAYETHRQSYNGSQIEAFKSAEGNPVKRDEALIKRLAWQKTTEDPLVTQDVNCLVIWTRPTRHIITLIQDLQQQIVSLIGPDLYLVPAPDIHLSVIELSHRHSVEHLRRVANEIGISRLQDILTYGTSRKVRLDSARLQFDRMGVALSFLPSKDDVYTYHHLRSDMHARVLDSGVTVDMCYTAPSAHITLGRFIGDICFNDPKFCAQFIDLTDKINDALMDMGDKTAWTVGEELSLELQLGYLKFGRERGVASLTGEQ